jgi:peroxiredoxin Q/BCP
MDRLEVGDRVPDFSALDQDGNTVRLKDYRGRKLVVFFFPRASTPGCTAQVCNLRDHYGELRKQGYELLGVSADSQRRQTNFRKKNNLDFPLVADEDHTVINTFGVWGPKKFMGRTFNGIHRTTFVIDKDGVVERVIDKVKTKDHAAQVLEPQ